MPELPGVKAHAERLREQFSHRVPTRFDALRFSALKTATPPPDAAASPAPTAGPEAGSSPTTPPVVS